MNPLTQSKNATILPVLIALTLTCFAFVPQARAVCREGCDSANTFLGEDALLNNTDGLSNTANGFEALLNNTSGNSNTGIGVEALRNNVTGGANTAVGYFALVSNRIGSNNTATGLSSLLNNTGDGNTAMGFCALLNNTIGHKNIAVGSQAGGNLTFGSFNVDIGNPGIAGESNTIRIGKTGDQTATYVAGINGATVPGGVTVVIDADGHLGTTTSSARYKEAIEPMNHAGEAILSLKPVTFRYNKELDPKAIPQFGLVAEEVVKVNPDLVGRDEHGKPYTVRYDAVNAMLLNEFLKEHRQVQEQQKEIAALRAAIRKQAAQIQEVSEEIKAGKTILHVASVAP